MIIFQRKKLEGHTNKWHHATTSLAITSVGKCMTLISFKYTVLTVAEIFNRVVKSKLTKFSSI